MRLCVKDLQVELGGKAILQEVTFSCPPGLVMLLGENGAGKTTLLKTLLGFVRPRAGEIWVEESSSEGAQEEGQGGGAERESARPRRLEEMNSRQRARILAYVPQETGGNLQCPAEEFVVMGRNPYLGILRQPGKGDYDKARQALEELEISHLARKRLEELSGGERRLVYLARARAQEAAWMLLDEPTASLDYRRQHQFLERLRDYTARTGTGALISINDPTLAYRYGDQLLLLSGHRLLDSLDSRREDFDRRMERDLKELYGEQITLAETPEGNTLIWREKHC